jgi:hypothetical protein
MLVLMKEALEDEGYKVFTADGRRKALSTVKRELIHLALIDVRLKDDRDETDYSGIHLAAKLPLEMRKIIMTGKYWKNPAKLLEQAHERDARHLLKYCDFISGSNYNSDGILSSIQHAFANNLPLISMKLKLKLEPNLSWETMVGQMKNASWVTTNGNSYGRSTALKPVRILQELSCLLFSSSPQKPDLVKFLSTTPGYSPCTVAMVRPYFETVPGLELAAKLGPSHSIETEYENFEKYVVNQIPFDSCTDVRYGPVYLQGTGALAYDFIGKDVKSVETLREHYGNSQVTDDDLCKTLTHLFSETCARWYQHRDKVSNSLRQRLDTLYRLQLNLHEPAQVKKTKDAFRSLLSHKGSLSAFKLLSNGVLQVDFKGKDQKLHLPDPLKFCFERRSSAKRGKGTNSRQHQNFFPVVDQYAITHGDLHSGNVIVNKQGGAWLIDFYKTGVGHALRDFAEMESDIKFTLFTGNLSARYELERALLRPNSLNESLFLEKPSLAQQRALRTIQTLRQQAFALTDIESTREYYMALLFYAVKGIRGFTSGSVTGQSYTPAKAHALLSAAMLCKRLSSTSANKRGAVFLAHDYDPCFVELIYTKASAHIKKQSFDVFHPLDDPGGNIWMRVAEMIDAADAGLYEISTGNGNVYFELGYAIGKHKPYFVLIDRTSELKRPPLIGGDLLYEYSGEPLLKKHVKGILDRKDKWEDRFFYLKPAFKTRVAQVKVKNRSAVLLVANTRRQKELAPLFTKILAQIHHRTVDVIPVEQQVNIEDFLLRLRKTQVVVGCLASDRSAKHRDANAELAMALGIAVGMGKKTIILQEKNSNVLTDLRSLTITFQGLHGAAKVLEAELTKAFPNVHRASASKKKRQATVTAKSRVRRVSN